MVCADPINKNKAVLGTLGLIEVKCTYWPVWMRWMSCHYTWWKRLAARSLGYRLSVHCETQLQDKVNNLVAAFRANMKQEGSGSRVASPSYLSSKRKLEIKTNTLYWYFQVKTIAYWKNNSQFENVSLKVKYLPVLYLSASATISPKEAQTSYIQTSFNIQQRSHS